MKTIIHFYSFDLRLVPQEVTDVLRLIYPEGVEYNGPTDSYNFMMHLPDDDGRAVRVLDVLKESGFTPWQDHSRQPYDNEYSVAKERVYDYADLIGSRYFFPHPRSYSEGLSRSEIGLIELDVDQLAAGAEIASAAVNRTIISDRLKQAIQTQDYKGLVLRPTSLVDLSRSPKRAIPWAGMCDPFCEVTSDLILPPLAPSCQLLDNDGKPCNGDFKNGCFLTDGLLLNPEPHYTESAIEQMEPFDFARTFETFGIRPDDDDRMLIVSSRVFQFLVEFGVHDVDWTPVRIDPD